MPPVSGNRPVSLTVFFSFQFFFFKVDNEFEEVATQLLKRTQAMLNKYRFLLLEDAMVKVCSQHGCLSGSARPRRRERVQGLPHAERSL